MLFYKILTTLFVGALISACSCLNGQNLTPESIIKQSIAYHNPVGDWSRFKDTLFIKQETPDESIRFRKAFVDNARKYFEFHGQYENGQLMYTANDQVGSAQWNDSASIPAAIKDKYKISPERALMYRNYYTYLYGMPMKLHDPGTIIHEGVEEVEFHDKAYYKIKVTYTPEVGKDTWFFYFDKNSFALGAYEFYHKEPTDGEYLLLDGIKTVGTMRLPRKIAWYRTKNDEFLGNDILE